MAVVAKLIDVSTCIGCKACEAACQEWNDNGFRISEFTGDYRTHETLAHDFWNLIQFNEVERPDGHVAWNMAKYQCMHCVDAGCMKACPAPGAIFRHENGTVDFDHDKCIGCGYCITGCPFDIPKLSPVTQKVYKCTLCSDRTSVGLEPACVKACPTNCLTFGARSDLVQIANARASTLRADGHEQAGVYNPQGVGGTNVLYVLPDASNPVQYGLPADPHISWTVSLWKGPLKWVGNLAFAGTIVGALFHYLRFGPKEEEKEGGDE
ncbi:MAG: formate dehydrogenase subunit beta [Bryobacterales bacterium]|nr:formate dehydrogenase subunit beta [Acidobacteriota bacterium]MCB9383758.1 formate dehydrogenase subunit beta [Bryobacterales bacterium]